MTTPILWKRYDSVTLLPAGLWEERIAKGRIELDERLMQLVEIVVPNDPIAYWVRFEEEQPTAIFHLFVQQEEMDGKLQNVAYSGSLETTDQHFWFDESHLTFSQFLCEMEEEARKWGVSFVRISIPCFPAHEAYRFDEGFAASDYVKKEDFTISAIQFLPNVHTVEEHLAALPSKYRKKWNRYARSFDTQRFRLELLDDFVPYLDQLYPLYLQVNARASEYFVEPYPQSYFEQVKRIFGGDAVMVVVRNLETNLLIGFKLMLFHKATCSIHYVGLSDETDSYLWHNQTIFALEYILNRGVRQVYMGLTNADGKKAFGSETFNSVQYLKEWSK